MLINLYLLLINNLKYHYKFKSKNWGIINDLVEIEAY